MLDRLESLCRAHKTNFSKLEKTLGFANGSLKKSKPETISAIRLKVLADYFEVSMEYLMTGIEPAASVRLTAEETAIIAAYRKKSEDAKDIVASSLGVKRQDTGLQSSKVSKKRKTVNE